MGKIAGIDLGTSTSEIAIFDNGKPLVLPNNSGEYKIPSVVGTDEEGKMITGKEARDQLLLKPKETVVEVKRLMGSEEKVKMGNRQFTPPQISSYILRYLVDFAENQLGDSIERAVITVPAYFSDEQRRATVEAGKLAGLKVERIINEPTAAALDYGIEHMKDCQNILVYDLGGGTLDVTVLEMFEGVLEVKASSGNNKLGGADFDRRIMDYLIKQFTSQYDVDISTDPWAMMRLREAAEKCKIELTSTDEYHVSLPFFINYKGKPVSLEETITGNTFEELIKDLVESTGKPIEVALSDAGLTAEDIDLVLLTGGSTRIPLVANFVARTLDKQPRSLIDPDLAVVRGAAIQGGILNEELSSEKDIMITDVCPYTLGIATLGEIGGTVMPDVFDTIIPRNTTIPVTKEKTYGTVYDYQSAVEIEAYQGEYKKASMNNLLGKFTLEGIPPAPAFEEKVKISFTYDVNGILQVEGIIASTGKNANITVETSSAGVEEEIELEEWNNAPNAKKYRSIIKKAEKILENDDVGPQAMEIDHLLKELKKGLVKQDKIENLNDIKEDLSEILLEIK